MKLSPQGGLGSLSVGLAQKEGMMVPRILPSEVWAFQIPMSRPRLGRGGGGGGGESEERERREGGKGRERGR